MEQWIEELKEKAKKATAGPWIAIDRHFEPRYVGRPENGVDECGGYEGICQPDKPDDVLYIAASSPNRILELITKVQELTEQVEKARQEGFNEGIESAASDLEDEDDPLAQALIEVLRENIRDLKLPSPPAEGDQG